jgi:hypothetical protein
MDRKTESVTTWLQITESETRLVNRGQPGDDFAKCEFEQDNRCCKILLRRMQIRNIPIRVGPKLCVL